MVTQAAPTPSGRAPIVSGDFRAMSVRFHAGGRILETSHEGVTMWSFSGPNAHQGSTPTRDPRIPGITSGGDFAQPSGSRPHREILAGAMVLVVALAAVAAWVTFRPDGSDAAARAAASEAGITVSEDWNVESIDGGFRVHRAFTAEKAPVQSASYFDIVRTTAVTAPADASTWTPKVSGATAYAEGDPTFKLLIDADAHHWIITPATMGVYGGGPDALAAWNDLVDSVAFTPGT